MPSRLRIRLAQTSLSSSSNSPPATSSGHHDLNTEHLVRHILKHFEHFVDYLHIHVLNPNLQTVASDTSSSSSSCNLPHARSHLIRFRMTLIDLSDPRIEEIQAF